MGDKKETIRLLIHQRDEAEARAAAEKQTRLNLAGALVDARRALATARQERDEAAGKALAVKDMLLAEAEAKIERLEADLAEKAREPRSRPTRVVIQAPSGAEVTFKHLPSAGSVWGGVI